MLILKLLVSFLKPLTKKRPPALWRAGLPWGPSLGLTPKGSLHNAVVVLLIFLLPVNKSASLVARLCFGDGLPVWTPCLTAWGNFC
jgi:hypothetical protein